MACIHFRKEKKLNFTKIDLPENIIEVSGIHEHCLALSKEGKVFGYGKNFNGIMGFDSDIEIISKFKEIPSLCKYKIKAAYAGVDHSLFLTDEDKVLHCGENDCG